MDYSTSRTNMLHALRQHAKANIELHRANVEVYLANPVGIGEHPGVMEAIQSEVQKMAEYHDQLEILKKYF